MYIDIRKYMYSIVEATLSRSLTEKHDIKCALSLLYTRVLCLDFEKNNNAYVWDEIL